MTLENYVLEQSINTASVNDIMLEQAIAEFEVSNALYECYLKTNLITEYSTSPVDDSDVYQEGIGDSLKEAGGKLVEGAKKAGRAAKNVVKTAWEMFMRAVEAFLNLFRKVDFGHLAASMNKLDDSDYRKINLGAFTILDETFNVANKLAEYLRNDRNEPKIYAKLQDDYKNIVAEASNTGYVKSGRITEKFIQIGSKYAKSNFEVGVHQLRKRVDFDGFLKRAEDAGVEVPSQTITIIKALLKNMTDTYIQATKALKMIVSEASAAQKETDAINKKHPGESSDVYNTEVDKGNRSSEDIKKDMEEYERNES